SLFLFWEAPAWWPWIIVAALAAGLGGATGWVAVGGRLSRPAWWRAALAGALGGGVVHPYYWVLVGCASGELFSPSDFLNGCLLSLMVMGIVTVPAGIFAALRCRALGRLNPSSQPTPNESL